MIISLKPNGLIIWLYLTLVLLQYKILPTNSIRYLIRPKSLISSLKNSVGWRFVFEKFEHSSSKKKLSNSTKSIEYLLKQRKESDLKSQFFQYLTCSSHSYFKPCLMTKNAV